MKPSVFISRDLTANSIFLQKLIPLDYKIHGESLIEFTAIPFSDTLAVDWIFFYSKNAVRFFFKQLHKSLPEKVKFAAIGERTATVLKEFVGTIDFIGNGIPEITAQNFLAIAKKERVLFPRAKRSRKSVQLLLQQEVKVSDLVVYDNQIKTIIKLDNYDILVFTSPLNVEAYFKCKPYRVGQTAVAIGNTTAEALHRIGIIHIYIAKETSEAGLAEAVQSIS